MVGAVVRVNWEIPGCVASNGCACSPAPKHAPLPSCRPSALGVRQTSPQRAGLSSHRATRLERRPTSSGSARTHPLAMLDPQVLQHGERLRPAIKNHPEAPRFPRRTRRARRNDFRSRASAPWCGDETLRMFVTPGTRFFPARISIGDGMPQRARTPARAGFLFVAGAKRSCSVLVDQARCPDHGR